MSINKTCGCIILIVVQREHRDAQMRLAFFATLHEAKVTSASVPPRHKTPPD